MHEPDEADTSPAAKQKVLGTFYTDDAVVQFLVSWALRRPHRSILDPSCGDGRFLLAAARLGAKSIVGCDVDPVAIDATRVRLANVSCPQRIIRSDFFALEPDAISEVDAVVGNPPFIRYQLFCGESRRRALESALRLGVRLTGLTSSWAPFVLHAVQCLRPGGDLAMVVPAEIVQTQYGRPTLRALSERFGSVTLLAFEQNLFVEAQEETFLLLASDYGGSACGARLIPLHDRSELLHVVDEARDGNGTEGIFLGADPDVRFVEAFLSPQERRAWHRVKEFAAVRELSSFGTLTNGYVSGANQFFHRTAAQAEQAGLPISWLRPTARSSKSFGGLFFKMKDIEALEDSGYAHHLVVPQHDLFGADPQALERFVDEGRKQRIRERFKCRARDPWWKVPGLARADVLLAYMAGRYPRAVVNSAEALYTNTIHGLRLRQGVLPELMVLSFHSSLTLLSLEVDGRSYGGGILKLEPTEMLRVRLAWPEALTAELQATLCEVDRLLRGGQYNNAVELVDAVLLERHLGVPLATIGQLRSGRERLLERRIRRVRGKNRGRKRSPNPDLLGCTDFGFARIPRDL
ncbi:MAG: N-6 DNA methylase [Candidatus Schekmanbacteria bacterium]|nr:N-6 DNA methylase [Candidatus Schekmanbacteria bacterium]